MAVDEEERRPAARVAVVPQLIYALLRLEPVHGGGHAEHAHEGAGGLLVAGGDGAPLLESGPEALDEVPVAVDVVGAGHRRFVALGRDRGPRAQSCRGLLFLPAPAAFWWARIEVPSRKVIPSEMPLS